MIHESKMKEVVLICFDLNNQNACFKYDGENLSEFVSSNEYHYQARLGHYKVGCVFPMDHRRWSFRPNSAWGSIDTTTTRTMHPTLVQSGNNRNRPKFFPIVVFSMKPTKFSSNSSSTCSILESGIAISPAFTNLKIPGYFKGGLIRRTYT